MCRLTIMIGILPRRVSVRSVQKRSRRRQFSSMSLSCIQRVSFYDHLHPKNGCLYLSAPVVSPALMSTIQSRTIRTLSTQIPSKHRHLVLCRLILGGHSSMQNRIQIVQMMRSGFPNMKMQMSSAFPNIKREREDLYE